MTEYKYPAASSGAGSGDVVGPSSATDKALVRYSGTTGKIIQSSTATLSDTGLLTTASVAISGLTATTVPYLNASKVLTSSAVTPTELGFLSGVSSAIQTQLGLKAPLASPTFTGTVTLPAGTISNADVNASAAIAYSKLATLATGQVLLGNAGTPTATALTGDVTVGATGVTAIGALKVTNAMLAGSIAYSKLTLTTSIVNGDISASAAIAYSKLSLATSIVNADISGSAAIAYSKLNLATSILNADVSASAAIAGTKISPDFGSQNVVTTGTVSFDGKGRLGSTSGLGTAAAAYHMVYGTVYGIANAAGGVGSRRNVVANPDGILINANIYIDGAGTSKAIEAIQGTSQLFLSRVQTSTGNVLQVLANYQDVQIADSAVIPTNRRTILTLLADGTLTVGAAGASAVNGLRLAGTTSGYSGLVSPAVGSSVTWVLPTADGSSGQFLKTDAAGNLSFGTPTAATTALAGTVTYEDSGFFPIYLKADATTPANASYKSVTGTAYYSRVGKTVTINLPDMNTSFGESYVVLSDSITNGVSTWPTGLRPGHTVTFLISTVKNAVYSVASASITTTGLFQVNSDIVGSTFGGTSVQKGTNACTITYTVA